MDLKPPSAADWLHALMILSPFWIVAGALRLLWSHIISAWFKRSKKANLILLVRPLRVLVVWGLVLAGLNYGLQSLQYVEKNPTLSSNIERLLTICWLVLAIVVAARLVGGWHKYQAIRHMEDEEGFRARVSTSQKLTTAVIIIVGSLMILRTAGIDISPLLAGGAIGGIILGLALQDSLSNVFAGLFLNIDRPIREGELLSLDGNREGFVEEVGWRYTKVRLINDSLLIIPNNKFSQSTFINLDRVSSSLAVNLNVYLAYGTNLDEAAAVAIEAAKEAQAATSSEEAPVEPYVRWSDLGEKMITMTVEMRVPKSALQYRLRSECIRRLHKKFMEKGIRFAPMPPAQGPEHPPA